MRSFLATGQVEGEAAGIGGLHKPCLVGGRGGVDRGPSDAPRGRLPEPC